MKKALLDNNFVYYSLLIFLVAIAIGGAISIQKFMGYATLSSEPPGTITTVLIDDRRTAYRWHGIFGLAFVESGFNETQSATLAPGEISNGIFVFTCIDPNQDEQEIYASTNDSLDFSSVRPGSIEMVDEDFLNFTNDTFNFDTAANGFTSNVSFLHGLQNISPVPALYSFVNDAPDPTETFYTGILNVSGELAFAIRLRIPSTTSFKGTNVRFQAILPVNNQTVTYYFYPDPNDVCPPNLGIGATGSSFIYGYVFHENTTSPIFNTSVSAAGNTTFTNASGFFNLSVPGGNQYNLVTFKQGYVINVTAVNTTIGNGTAQNISLNPFFGYLGKNATISGHVQVNGTGAPISGAVIHIEDKTLISNGSGNYSTNVKEGTHIITAVAPTYFNFVGNFSITEGENISYIINMTEVREGVSVANGTEFKNGTLQGTVFDNSTNETLVNVTVSVQGAVNITDPNGSYTLSALNGTTNLVATKKGYESFTEELNITADVITIFNFSMQPVLALPDQRNGSVHGLVRDTSAAPLEDAFVSVAGVSDFSNTTGDYDLDNVTPGTHIIIATLSGYENYFATINVTPTNATYHNITMITLDEAGLGPGQGPGLGVGDGPGLGPGQGPGRGPGTAIEPQVEEPREIPDFKVSVEDIIKKIEEGNFINVPITISNYLEDSIAISFDIEGSVAPLVRIDQNSMSIEGGSDAELLLTILGNRDPGAYDGFLTIEGDIEDQVPLYVLIKEKDRLDVENLVVKITPEKRVGVLGSKFNYRLDAQNLLVDEQYDVNFTYLLEGINNNVSLFIEQEGFEILTSFTLLKSYKLPTDIPSGDYRLVVIADYLGIRSEYATIFSAREPFYKYEIFGVLPVWILFVLAAIAGLLSYFVWLIKKKAEDKKRFHIDLDYGLLPKAGPRSAFVGLIAETTKKTYFDLDQMQTHTLVAGSTGSGKSVASQGIVEEALLKGTAVMVFDPTVQWTGFLSRCQDKKFLELYPKFGLKKSDARAFNGNIHQILDAREVIEFKKYIKPSEINVFVVNRLETKDYEVFVSNVIRQVFHENMPESKLLKLVLVFDEFHRLLPKYGGTGQVLIQIERAAREFRKWGVGLVLISQVISDFQPEVLANINTQLQMRTKDEGDLTRTKNEYGERYLQSLVKANVGAGMVENSAYNKGRPYFVQFRPLLHNTGRVSDEDLANYNKYNKIIDDLDYQLEQLAQEGIDIFDLQLELKLALDKVKSGSFNMVDIYLEGLKPRIAAQWKKIGKEPQKKQTQYVNSEDLTKELEKAKEMQQKDRESHAGSNDSAIEKAKKAKEESQNDQPKEKDDSSDSKGSGGEGIDSTIEQINSTADKGALISVYKKLQAIYKTASKEDKIKILSACKQIQAKIA